jgi:tRNA dimethylallyltransferase
MLLGAMMTIMNRKAEAMMTNTAATEAVAEVPITMNNRIQKPQLIVISGPTGSGKTSLSIRLAQALNCSIVSADSRQVFKEMRIGSAAPNETQLQQIPHYFIGSKHIHDPFNAGIFEQEALETLATLFKENPIQIVCGGTGLYIDALLNGFDELPESDPEIRQELDSIFANSGLQALQIELHNLDPVYYEQVDIHNPQRIMRALEVIRKTGLPYSSLRKKKMAERDFQVVYLATDLARETLYANINERTEKMIEQGWLKEAEELYPHRKLNALQTVGYKELFTFFDGEISLERAIELIQQNTRRYAKRQLTWLRNKQEIHWINPQAEAESLIRKFVF